MISVREAILRAASTIEANPGCYDHLNRDGGCMLYHIGTHLGLTVDDYRGYEHHTIPRDVILKHDLADKTARNLGFSYFVEFVDKVENIGGRRIYGSASGCAQALRKYADKFHPAENKPSNLRTGIPDMVTEIFERVAA